MNDDDTDSCRLSHRIVYAGDRHDALCVLVELRVLTLLMLSSAVLSSWLLQLSRSNVRRILPFLFSSIPQPLGITKYRGALVITG